MPPPPPTPLSVPSQKQAAIGTPSSSRRRCLLPFFPGAIGPMPMEQPTFSSPSPEATPSPYPAASPSSAYVGFYYESPPLPSPAAAVMSAPQYYGAPPLYINDLLPPSAAATLGNVLGVYAGHSNDDLIGGIVAGVAVFTFFAFLLACICCLLRCRRRRMLAKSGAPAIDPASAPPSGGAAFSSPTLVEAYPPSKSASDVRVLRPFTYAQLSAATLNFDQSRFLGRGGFGPVYKGCLDDGSFVAVKCIAENSQQGIKEFMSEVTIISDIRHRNLVRLRGWCQESEGMNNNSLFLIYDYLPNGSLDAMLFDDTRCGDLTWRRRFGIALGLGSALQYLHEECEAVIIHRDVKASNVLLDENFVAKLGDFGLSRQLGEEAEGHTTVVAGTIGYLAPEVHQTGRSTRESDIYSFGVVLAELATGRRARDLSKPPEGWLVVDWIRRLHEHGQLLEAADCRLSGDFDVAQMERLLFVALSCAQHDPWRRPSASNALNSLKAVL